MDRWEISWWGYTGEYGPFRGSVSSPVMVNLKTGERVESRDLPLGACFDANRDPHTNERCADYPAGADGCSIVCVTPRTTPPTPADAGHWYIDSRANNCTMKDDNEHRCWVRHGTVGEALTVDKAGKTCAAGAGSIQTAGWHGFLQNGVLHP